MEPIIVNGKVVDTLQYYGSAEENAEQINKDLVPFFVTLLQRVEAAADAYEREEAFKNLPHHSVLRRRNTSENTVVGTTARNNINAESRRNVSTAEVRQGDRQNRVQTLYDSMLSLDVSQSDVHTLPSATTRVAQTPYIAPIERTSNAEKRESVYENLPSLREPRSVVHIHEPATTRVAPRAYPATIERHHHARERVNMPYMTAGATAGLLNHKPKGFAAAYNDWWEKEKEKKQSHSFCKSKSFLAEHNAWWENEKKQYHESLQGLSSTQQSSGYFQPVGSWIPGGGSGGFGRGTMGRDYGTIDLSGSEGLGKQAKGKFDISKVPGYVFNLYNTIHNWLADTKRAPSDGARDLTTPGGNGLELNTGTSQMVIISYQGPPVYRTLLTDPYTGSKIDAGSRPRLLDTLYTPNPTPHFIDSVGRAYPPGSSYKINGGRFQKF